MSQYDGISRRSVLKALPAAALVALAPDVARAAAEQGSAGAVVEQLLDVRLTQVAVPGLGTVTTRTYNGTIPGPTLRVRAGDTLRLTQVNGLPPNQDAAGGHNRPHGVNSFNLHTHGLHVSPSGDADNVLREFAPRTADQVSAGAPEPRYVSTVQLPPGHPAGTYWYHPHLHGATAAQIVGGLAGVLIVEGDVDQVPEIKAAAEVVVCINELRFKGGKVPDFTAGNSLSGTPPVFTVNGAVNPTLTLRPGEVQRWRLVAATAFVALPLRITGSGGGSGGSGGPTMHQIAQDGVTFAAPVATDLLRLAMGNRADILIQGGAPGTYQLRADGVPTPLLTVQVAGAAVDPPMKLPAALPPGKPFLDEKEIANPDADRQVVLHVDGGVFGAPFPNAYRMLGTQATPAAEPGGDLSRDMAYGLFDPDYVNHRLTLGRVERWTVRNGESSPAVDHPFHLHTNHVLVTHRGTTKLDPPVWHDTVGLLGGSPGESVTFLVKYEDFTGRTVAHCHQLQHSDLGMMQNVDYVAGA
jgi:FtsP/CotA-like multicopper oxidase with cupredoxin domain